MNFGIRPVSGSINKQEVTSLFTNNQLFFPNVTSSTSIPSIIQLWKAATSIEPYRFLSVSTSGEFLLEMSNHEIEGDDNVNIIGVSVTGANYQNDTVKVCTNGVFLVQLETETEAKSGDYIERSKTEDGKATVGSPGDGTVGVALNNANSGELVYCIWKKHDV